MFCISYIERLATHAGTSAMIKAVYGGEDDLGEDEVGLLRTNSAIASNFKACHIKFTHDCA